ncbi:2-oxoacid:acceptor oxidoreductase subunit alpha [Chloroflexota bacterium]
MSFTKRKSKLPPAYYYFSGDEAIAEGAIAARCKYYAGYPITPATEIMERMSWRLMEVGGVFMQMEDEIGSICSAIGASWTGTRSMTATSGPGLSLMMEGIGYAAFTETPVVIADIQRAGPCTGQATRTGAGDIMQAKWGSHGDYQVIALSPWSVQESYEQTIRAFNLADSYRVPVFILSEEAVGHLRERIWVGDQVEIIERLKKKGAPPFGTAEEDGIPSMPAFGDKERILVTGSTHNDKGIRKVEDPDVHQKLVSRLQQKILNNRSDIIDYECYYPENAVVIVIAYGFTARSALYAVNRLREEKKKVGLVRMKTIWPFACEMIREVSSNVNKLFVPEMNEGQVAGEIIKYSHCEVVSYGQSNGEIITPDRIEEELRRLL